MTNDPPQAPQNDHSAPVKVGCPAGFSSECSYWTSNDVCRCNTTEYQHAQQALIIRALRDEITRLHDALAEAEDDRKRFKQRLIELGPIVDALTHGGIADELVRLRAQVARPVEYDAIDLDDGAKGRYRVTHDRPRIERYDEPEGWHPTSWDTLDQLRESYQLTERKS